MRLRSREIVEGIERAGARALLRAVGLTDKELAKPFVAVANSWNEIVPGHYHLRRVAEAVKAGVREAGGTPFEFNTIAICDGITQGHVGMYYSLPSREVISDSVELMVQAHRFDALILIASCDKIVPGMLMAAARINIPSIFVPGGPMLPGRFNDHDIALSPEMREFAGAFRTGKMSEEEFHQAEIVACPGPGSCAMLGTANTMQCVAEALGMALPGSSTAHAVSSKNMHFAKESGRQIMELIRKDIKPSDILIKEVFENATRVVVAMGGSLNAVLHIPAIANEVGIDLNLGYFDKISRETPHIVGIKPSGPYFMKDVDEAGGVPAIMKELKPLLHLDVLTVTGKTLKENLQDVKILKTNVIRPINNPFHKEGGIAVLWGNLAPRGAIVRQVAVNPEMMQHVGPARVFKSQEAAVEALIKGRIKPGDVIVVRYEGPKGGPGMREMHIIGTLLVGMGLGQSTGLITDGRLSGGTRGPAIAYVSPEAAEGGPIAVVKDGDSIELDIPNRKLNVLISEEELKKRLKEWKPPEPRIKKGVLARYRLLAESADKGAILS